MDHAEQDEQYRGIAAEFGPAFERLARAMEADAGERRDLLQEIHLAVWRSLAGFDGRCSMRTWVYRVSHNAAASHVMRRRRTPKGVSLEDLVLADDRPNPEETAGDRQALDRLLGLIRALKAPDAQIMLLYLEDIDAATIGEITGISPGAIATKIHRIKAVLTKRFEGGRDD